MKPIVCLTCDSFSSSSASSKSSIICINLSFFSASLSMSSFSNPSINSLIDSAASLSLSSSSLFICLVILLTCSMFSTVSAEILLIASCACSSVSGLFERSMFDFPVPSLSPVPSPFPMMPCCISSH